MAQKMPTGIHVRVKKKKNPPTTRLGMIKLTVEITNENFNYEYTVAETRHKGERKLCADSLAAFTDLLRLCSNHIRYEDKIWERDVLAKAWAEKQPRPASEKESK